MAEDAAAPRVAGSFTAGEIGPGAGCSPGMAVRLRRRSPASLPPMTGIEIAFAGPLQCRQIEPDQRAHQPQRAGAHLEHAGPHPGTDLLCRRRPRHPGRHARLRLRGGAQGQGRRLDRTDPRLSHAGAPICRASMCWSMRAVASATPTIEVLAPLDDAAVSYQIVLTKADAGRRPAEPGGDRVPRQHPAAFPSARHANTAPAFPSCALVAVGEKRRGDASFRRVARAPSAPANAGAPNERRA